MKNYFETVYGNLDTVRYFTAAIKSGKLAHAYILEGPCGCGKRTLAKAIAYARAKDSPFADKILVDQSPDVMYFGLADKKKTIGVDTVRALKSAVYIKPNELDAKFFILTDCQAMTPGAQNAALKILEEPPQNVYFFLCTDSAAALLPTVRSRAQTIRMQIFSPEEMAHYAKKNEELQLLSKRDPLRFTLLLRQSGGCLGKLQTDTEDTDEAALQESAAKLISLLDAGEYTPLLLCCTKLASSRGELDTILFKTALGLRDVLTARTGMQHTLQFYQTNEEALNAAKHLTHRGILGTITEIEKIRSLLTANPNLKGILALLADNLLRATQN